jgi:multidrug efflux pump subunit AcrA (membrane-fusion protein)
MSALSRVLLIPGCWLLLSCGSKEAAESDTAPRPEVRVARVESRSIQAAVEATGQWKAAVETVLPAPFDAVVESIPVRPGDRVRRGATLAWCRTIESDAVVHGAELMARQATDPQSRQDASRALAEARSSIVRVPVVSPASGTVLRRQADAGSRLTSGSELLAIVADDVLVFEVRVPASEATAIRPGLGATISDGDGPPRAALVWTLPPAAAGDQSTLVWLRPLAPPPHLALGRFGTASIATGHAVNMLAVPDTAVVEDDLTGGHRIAVVDSSHMVRWVDVRLGARVDHAQAVFGRGLEAGTAVVVDGQRALLDGMHVMVRP